MARFQKGGFFRTLKKASREPQYFEDYDLNDDGVINVVDIQGWGNKGRRDVQKRVANMVMSGNFPKKRSELSRAARQRRRRLYGVPRTQWLKMKPSERREQLKIWDRSPRARYEQTLRNRRMFRGASAQAGDFPNRNKRDRLRRTSERMFRKLERGRRRWRVRKLGRHGA